MFTVRVPQLRVLWPALLVDQLTLPLWTQIVYNKSDTVCNKAWDLPKSKWLYIVGPVRGNGLP